MPNMSKKTKTESVSESRYSTVEANEARIVYDTDYIKSTLYSIEYSVVSRQTSIITLYSQK